MSGLWNHADAVVGRKRRENRNSAPVWTLVALITNRGWIGGRSCSVASRTDVCGMPQRLCSEIEPGNRMPPSTAASSIVLLASGAAAGRSPVRTSLIRHWPSNASLDHFRPRHTGGNRSAGHRRDARQLGRKPDLVQAPERADMEQHRAIAAARQTECRAFRWRAKVVLGRSGIDDVDGRRPFRLVIVRRVQGLRDEGSGLRAQGRAQGSRSKLSDDI